MSFTAISSTAVDANSPVTETLMDLIRTNLDDLDSRLGGVAGYTALISTTDFATTAASTSTITMNTDQTSAIRPGEAIRITSNSVVQYYVCTAITAGLLTVAGAPLATGAGLITALGYGGPQMTVQVDLFLSGAFGALLNSDLLMLRSGARFEWQGADAYLVRAEAYTKKAWLYKDTFTISFSQAWDNSDERFNATINGIAITEAAFNTNNATTLTGIATNIQASKFILTATSNGTDTITIVGEPGIDLAFSGVACTGTTPPTPTTTQTVYAGQTLNVNIGSPAKLNAGQTDFATTTDVFSTPVRVVGELVSLALTPTSSYDGGNIGYLTDFIAANVWSSTSRAWSDLDVIFSLDLGSSQRIKGLAFTMTNQPTGNGAGWKVVGSATASPTSTDWIDMIPEPVASTGATDTPYYYGCNHDVRHIRMQHSSTGASGAAVYSISHFDVYDATKTFSLVTAQTANYGIVNGQQVFVRLDDIGDVTTDVDRDCTLSLTFAME